MKLQKILLGFAALAMSLNVFAADLTRVEIEQKLKNSDKTHVADLRRKDFRTLDLSKLDFRSGCFSQDSRGRWYFNIVIQLESVARQAEGGQIGIDLGLKTTATCSNGDSFARQNCYRNLELKLGKAQRAKNKKRVKAIHAKIKNTRKDAIHKFTNKIVRENSLIIVGNVSSQKLAKSGLAKSVLDAGWFMLIRFCFID